MSRAIGCCVATLLILWRAAAAAAADVPAPAATVLAVPKEWLEAYAADSRFATWSTLGLGLLTLLLGMVTFGVSSWLVVRQMRDTQRWNVRKTSEETLGAMITGTFPDFMDRLILEFDWDILGSTGYDAVAATLEPSRLVRMEVILRNVLRHLEVTCINMKNGIIDEEMCFDYLRSIMTTFYANCEGFIAKERERRQEQKIFREVEFYAQKWVGIIEQEKRGRRYEVLRKDFAKAG